MAAELQRGMPVVAQHAAAATLS
ncbi:MAG: hypothetical protein QOI15_1558, partial [Pseudonocardiales bacterium]|nr:hypothetical protein [Pseudonocardiales bacterium]